MDAPFKYNRPLPEIKYFQLFLFDFDGLLVNTEKLHYQAYVDALAQRGYQLDWSFDMFRKIAHLNAEALMIALYREFPELQQGEWETFYSEKKKVYLDLLHQGKVELMPGVETLLTTLDQEKIRRCVVTHSPFDQIDKIRKRHLALQTIPHWITREDYTFPKPHPEGYLRAIALHGQKGDRIIGFEDSYRGIEALKQTPAVAVLICHDDYPLIEKAKATGVLHFESLDCINRR